MSAKEYARLMREELYRQNKNILEVTDDLWLAIADNMEKFAEWAVEEHKNRLVEKMEKHKQEIESRKERDILNRVAKTNARVAIEEDIKIVKSGGVAND